MSYNATDFLWLDKTCSIQSIVQSGNFVKIELESHHSIRRHMVQHIHAKPTLHETKYWKIRFMSERKIGEDNVSLAPFLISTLLRFYPQPIIAEENGTLPWSPLFLLWPPWTSTRLIEYPSWKKSIFPHLLFDGSLVAMSTEVNNL